MKVKILALAAFALAFAACSPKGGWTPAELDIISADVPLPVLTIFDREENIFLRTPCSELSAEEIRSEHYGTLCKALLGTVTDPSQDGVGIAGPQVGLGRRIVAVQRFDKEGEPFEVYPNIRIDSLFGAVTLSTEGCLSVPDLRGYVPRREGAVISYTDPETLTRVSETVRDFTAIIFQHECDHLDGILYTDRADSVFFSERSAAERMYYDSLGYYVKPSVLIR